MTQLAWEHREILVGYAIPIKEKKFQKTNPKTLITGFWAQQVVVCNDFYKKKNIILVLFLSNSFVRDEKKGFCKRNF